MNAKQAERLKRIREGRIQRARELVAQADVMNIEIGFEGEFTTFCPMSVCPPRFIEEATILSHEIKALKEGRTK